MTDDLYASFRKLSPKVTGGLVRMREDSFKDAFIPAKYKILAALVTVVVTRCKPCLRAYTKMAFQAGATLEELVEFLNVAITEGGCPGETWALKAFETYKNLQTGEVVIEEVCCTLEDNYKVVFILNRFMCSYRKNT